MLKQLKEQAVLGSIKAIDMAKKLPDTPVVKLEDADEWPDEIRSLCDDLEEEEDLGPMIAKLREIIAYCDGCLVSVGG